jgi:hypothetical protein
MLEAIAGVGIGLATARDWTDVWSLTCNISISTY